MNRHVELRSQVTVLGDRLQHLPARVKELETELEKRDQVVANLESRLSEACIKVREVSEKEEMTASYWRHDATQLAGLELEYGRTCVELSFAQALLTESEHFLLKQRRELESKEEKMRHMECNLEEIHRALQTAKQETLENRDTIVRLFDAAENHKAQSSVLQRRIQELQMEKSTSTTELSAKVQEYLGQCHEKDNTIAELTEQIHRKDAQGKRNEHLTSQLSSTEAAVVQATASITDLETKVQELEQHAKTTREECEKYLSQCHEKDNAIAELTEQLILNDTVQRQSLSSLSEQAMRIETLTRQLSSAEAAVEHAARKEEMSVKALTDRVEELQSLLGHRDGEISRLHEWNEATCRRFPSPDRSRSHSVPHPAGIAHSFPSLDVAVLALLPSLMLPTTPHVYVGQHSLCALVLIHVMDSWGLSAFSARLPGYLCTTVHFLQMSIQNSSVGTEHVAFWLSSYCSVSSFLNTLCPFQEGGGRNTFLTEDLMISGQQDRWLLGKEVRPNSAMVGTAVADHLLLYFLGGIQEMISLLSGVHQAQAVAFLERQVYLTAERGGGYNREKDGKYDLPMLFSRTVTALVQMNVPSKLIGFIVERLLHNLEEEVWRAFANGPSGVCSDAGAERLLEAVGPLEPWVVSQADHLSLREGGSARHSVGCILQLCHVLLHPKLEQVVADHAVRAWLCPNLTAPQLLRVLVNFWPQGAAEKAVSMLKSEVGHSKEGNLATTPTTPRCGVSSDVLDHPVTKEEWCGPEVQHWLQKFYREAAPQGS